MEIQRLHVGQRLSEVVIHNNTLYLAGQAGAGGIVTAARR